MVKKKGKSKRVTFKQKYKIERRVKDHKRKVKKESNRRAKLGLPPAGIGRRRNDTGIPNAWPFKEQLLEELAAAKRRAEDEKQQRKLEAAQRRKQGLVGSDVSQLVAQAEARTQVFEVKSREQEGKSSTAGSKDMRNLGQQSRRAYIRDLKEVIEQSDVILQVLDARDPCGSRADAVEELITRKGKKLVLVLNKVDLVPREVVGEWLTYLRKYHPTVAFKAATQEGRSGLAQHDGDASKASQNVLSRSGSVGSEAIMNLLKNYCRNVDIKTSITVGIIGYPNVGKSSLINSLKRVKSVGVSSTPGFTKSMQEIQLDRHIKLLDSPGIVFDDDDVDSVLLRNCINVDTLPDPVQAVNAMLQRCDPQDLMMVYALPRFDEADVMGFLALLARKKGKLLKGGVPDRNAAARILLRDWNTGKVPFYTKPPSEADSALEVGAATLPTSALSTGVVSEEAQLLGSLGEAFDVFKEADARVVQFLEGAGPDAGQFVAFRSGNAGKARSALKGLEGEDHDGGDAGVEMDAERVDEDDEEGDDSDEGDEDEMKVQQAEPERRVIKRVTRKSAAMDLDDDGDEPMTANTKVNQSRTRQLKTQKKKEAKNARRAAARGGATESDASYDFATDFHK